MIKVSKAVGIVIRLMPVLLFVQLFSAVLDAQIVPSLRTGDNLSAFGTFTHANSEDGQQPVYGYTIGGIWQSSDFLGIEARGTALSFGDLDHQYSALAGFRAETHLSRFSPYVAVLGGAGHARWRGETDGRLDSATDRVAIGAEWNFLGGIDWYALHRMSIRLGEISYSKIYAEQGLTSLSVSGGIVYRLPF